MSQSEGENGDDSLSEMDDDQLYEHLLAQCDKELRECSNNDYEIGGGENNTYNNQYQETFFDALNLLDHDDFEKLSLSHNPVKMDTGGLVII